MMHPRMMHGRAASVLATAVGLLSLGLTFAPPGAGAANTCPNQCLQAPSPCLASPGTCLDDNRCLFEQKLEGATCDDGKFSTRNDTCRSGVCVGGVFRKVEVPAMETDADGLIMTVPADMDVLVRVDGLPDISLSNTDRQLRTARTAIDGLVVTTTNLQVNKADKADVAASIAQLSKDLMAKIGATSKATADLATRVDGVLEDRTARLDALEARCVYAYEYDNSGTCTPLKTCADDEFEATAPAMKQNRACQNHRASCTSDEFQVVAPTRYRDRQCQTARPCKAGAEFERSAPTLFTDRVCQALHACKEDVEFERVKPTATADRVCQTITVCGPGLAEAVAPTASTDRKCAKIAASCQDHKALGESTNGVYDITSGGKSMKVLCDMALGGGGWTLVMTNSDDGVARFTGARRAIWTDDTVFGSPTAPGRDFKSLAYSTVPFKEVMFRIHVGVWVSYQIPDTKGRTMMQWYKDRGYEQTDGCTQAPSPAILGQRCCAGSWNNKGYKQTGGTLVTRNNLCNTRLYINPMDHEGTSTCMSDENAWGPTWNDKTGGGCAFDDPGVYSNMGGQWRSGTSKGTSSESGLAGFGFSAGYNDRSEKNNAAKYVQMYVR